jgi:hypothetical protein
MGISKAGGLNAPLGVNARAIPQPLPDASDGLNLLTVGALGLPNYSLRPGGTAEHC